MEKRANFGGSVHYTLTISYETVFSHEVSNADCADHVNVFCYSQNPTYLNNNFVAGKLISLKIVCYYGSVSNHHEAQAE